MPSRSAITLFVIYATFAGPLRAEDEERIRDEQTLREAHLTWDGPALVGYFRQRTPTEIQRQSIQNLIRQLDDRSFRVRENATKELTGFGLTAIGLLKQGKASADPEIASRCAKCLAQVEAVPSGLLTASVARMVGRVKPAGGLDAILAYLPMADDDAASEGLRWALARLAVRDGRVEPALLNALSNPVAVRRGAAAEAIVRSGLKGHFAAVSNLRRDPDEDVRLRTALVLVTVAKDKAAVEDLVAMLETLPVHRGWQAEEVLHRIAGEEGPKVSLVGGDAARRKCRIAWAEWWAKNAVSVDLTRLGDGERMLGNTVMILRDVNSTEGRVLEYGPDGKTILWQINGLQMPLDVQVLPQSQRVLIAEHNSHVVTERDFQGKVHWKYAISQPVACQRLADGNTFIAARDRLVEVDRNGKIAFQLARGAQADIVAARKSREGHYVFATFHGRVTRVDANKNELRSFSAPQNLVSYSSMQLLPNHRVLITTTTGAVELDEESGKPTWQATVGGITSSVQRLPNGNTLVCAVKPRAIFEVDRDGKILTEQPISEAIPWRVLRR
jgi:hypothetical protein